MYYISPNKNPHGAYSAPQTTEFADAVVLSDALAHELLAYNGFVTLHVQEKTVTGLSPDFAAWEQWKQAQQAAQEEVTAEDISLQLLCEHELRLCMLELLS